MTQITFNSCSRPECQTTAGCAHRGPAGEFCWFSEAVGERHRFTGAVLTEQEREVLVILQEECAEVVMAASKLLRFGKETFEGYGDNQGALGLELGDLLEMVDRVLSVGLVSADNIYRGRARKRACLPIYSRYL